MDNALMRSLLFLINTLFSMYILIVMLRFLLQWVKADFYNPVCQFLMTMTNPLLLPLRRVIPGFFGLDCAAIVLMVVLQGMAIGLVMLILGQPLSFLILLVAVVKLLQLMINVFFFSIIIQVILSWVNPQAYNPAVTVVNQLSEPLLAPVRRWIKPVGGFDFSALIVLIILQVVSYFVGAMLF